MEGLQGIFATASRDRVKRAVRSPLLAAARAASTPACPAPATITSYLFIDISFVIRKFNSKREHHYGTFPDRSLFNAADLFLALFAEGQHTQPYEKLYYRCEYHVDKQLRHHDG